MNITIPENLNRTEAIAYQVGMENFKVLCHQIAEERFPAQDASVDWMIALEMGMKCQDLGDELVRSFTDLADQRIRFAMETLELHAGYATPMHFKQAAKRAIITMVPIVTLENLLAMKEDELVNG